MTILFSHGFTWLSGSVLLLLLAIPSRAEIPTTQNSAAGPRGGRLELFRSSLDEIDLNDTQRQKVDALLSEAAMKLRGLQTETPDIRREKLRDTMGSLRDQMAGILTPPQLNALRQKMQARQEKARNTPAVKIAPPPVNPASVAKALPATRPVVNLEIASHGVGDSAPDVRLKKPDGNVVQLSTLGGRIVVLVFGSYSCPTFRDRAPALDRLRLDLASQATFLFVYTREAHPIGGWEVERNKDEKIAVAEPGNDIERRSIVNKARAALKLTASFPLVMDSMDDATTSAFDGFPNAAVVIGRDGKIIAKQQWAEPVALRRMVVEALNEPKITTQPAIKKEEIP